MDRKKFTGFVFAVALGAMATIHQSVAQTNGPAEEVIRRAVAALAANDQPTLDKLSIDQAEFKKYVWPGMASQMSGSNTNAEKYYGTFQKVSQVGINEAAATLAGKKWDVVKVDLDQPQRKGKGFLLFRAPLVTLRDESGEQKTVRLIGGLLERDGSYKVTSFYVSPALRAGK
jgi:hypothetical protein